jgi:N-methylhydantoinase A
VFSALGCVVADVAYDRVQTFRHPLAGLGASDLDARFASLVDAVQAPLRAEGHPAVAIAVRRSVDMRYVGQNYELTVPWEGDPGVLRAAFEDLHRRLYAYATGDAVECVNLRVRASVDAGPVRLPEWTAAGPGRPFAEQEAHFPETGATTLPVYRRVDLVPDRPVQGPALVEDPWATSLIYPGQAGRLDRLGNLLIEVRP